MRKLFENKTSSTFCVAGIPCNPLNLTSAFGWDFPSVVQTIKVDGIGLYQFNKDLIKGIPKNVYEICNKACPKSCMSTRYEVFVTPKPKSLEEWRLVFYFNVLTKVEHFKVSD